MDESGEHRIIRRRDVTKRRLSVVPDPIEPEMLEPAAARPRTIGRLIAQAALLADSALARDRDREDVHRSNGPGRRFGWFV